MRILIYFSNPVLMPPDIKITSNTLDKLETVNWPGIFASPLTVTLICLISPNEIYASVSIKDLSIPTELVLLFLER